MIPILRIVVLGMLVAGLSGCLSPRGDTTADKRTAIQNMKKETMASLYRQKPAAKGIVNRAAGYAVFSNVSAQFVWVGGGAGYGVVVDGGSGQQTYMKMVQADVGLGLGIQDIRVVFIFHSRRALEGFINHGWEFGGQADAAAKTKDQGAAATGEVSIDSETTIYTLSEAGLMAKVNLAGTKYWKDYDLNAL